MSTNHGPRIYIVAGETSGDHHAGELAHAILQRAPRAWIGGVGGQHLRAAGQDQIFDLAQHAVVGLTDVLLNYRKFRSFFHKILDDIAEKQPDVVVLVDFPGFNLRLARALRRRLPKIRLVYYIAPQVWAWKSGRAKEMERILDLLLVLFPFEKEWFAARTPGLRVEWVGHPLVERAAAIDREALHHPAPEEPLRVVLLPGSRRREVKEHLKIMLDAADRIRLRRPGSEFTLLAPDDERARQAGELKIRCGHERFPLDIKVGYAFTHMARSHLALVASGTATLECAVAGVPMLILYKVNPITYAVGRMVLKLPYIGMINVLAGKKIVPEFIQGHATPGRLAGAAARLYTNAETWSRMRADILEVTAQLGNPGASGRAASAILDVCRDGTHD